MVVSKSIALNLKMYARIPYIKPLRIHGNHQVCTTAACTEDLPLILVENFCGMLKIRSMK